MIEVLEPGTLTTVQDAFGRPGWRHVGVPVGGTADAWSARLANRLVGNPDGAPLLELTLYGPTLRFQARALVALAGRMDAAVDGVPVAACSGTWVRAGATLAVTSGQDARAYLAVAGGLRVEPVLGSASTDLRSGFGGLEGRALREGDRLAVAPVARPAAARWAGSSPSGRIRVVAGPHAAPGLTEELTSRSWRVAAAADRTGVRLDGPALERRDAAEVPSMGLPLGAVQLPPDGRPIVMLVDRPVTGGYPVPAVVIGADVGRIARLRPGDALALESVSLEDAVQARRVSEAELSRLEPLASPGDAEVAWAGSHR